MGPFGERHFSKIGVAQSAIHTPPGVEFPEGFTKALERYGTQFWQVLDGFVSR